MHRTAGTADSDCMCAMNVCGCHVISGGSMQVNSSTASEKQQLEVMNSNRLIRFSCTSCGRTVIIIIIVSSFIWCGQTKPKQTTTTTHEDSQLLSCGRVGRWVELPGRQSITVIGQRSGQLNRVVKRSRRRRWSSPTLFWHHFISHDPNSNVIPCYHRRPSRPFSPSLPYVVGVSMCFPKGGMNKVRQKFIICGSVKSSPHFADICWVCTPP